MTALTSSSKSTGSTMMLRGMAWNRPELIGDQLGRQLAEDPAAASSAAHWPSSPSPDVDGLADGRPAVSSAKAATRRSARQLGALDAVDARPGAR